MFYKSIKPIISCAILALALATTAFASDEGTIIIEQKNTEYLGEWGLGSATGAIDGESPKFTSVKPAGVYSLTVTPPAGAVTTIEVHVDGVIVETVESRSVNATLGSGGTLQFNIFYEFSRVGDVGVTSSPAGIDFELRGPLETVTGTTPASYPDSVVGTYTVYFHPPSPCVIPRPIARSLDEGRRIGLTIDFPCAGSTSVDRTPNPDPEPEPEPEAPAQTPKLRISLSPSSREVTAGGITRLSLVVLNRSEMALSNLTADYRYDNTKMSVQGARNAQISGNRVTWTIPSLPAGARWEQSFSAHVNDAVANGTNISSTVTVSGDDLSGVSVTKRSGSTQFGVMTILPETGAYMPLDALMLILLFGFSVLMLGVGGVVEMARHA